MRVLVKIRCTERQQETAWNGMCSAIKTSNMVPTWFPGGIRSVNLPNLQILISDDRLRFRSDESQFAHLAGYLDGWRLWSSRRRPRHVARWQPVAASGWKFRHSWTPTGARSHYLSIYVILSVIASRAKVWKSSVVGNHRNGSCGTFCRQRKMLE
jgi:hypothetical protein